MLSYSLTKNVNLASCYSRKREAEEMIDIVKTICNELKNVTLLAEQVLNGWGIRIEVPRELDSDAYCYLVLMKN